MLIFLPFRTKPRGASFAASLFFIRFIANNWPGAHFSYFSIRYEANDFIYIFWNCISFDVFFSISLFFSHIFVAAAAAAVCDFIFVVDILPIGKHFAAAASSTQLDACQCT